MLSAETSASIPDWNKRKIAQWSAVFETVARTLPGLQFSRFGERQSTFQVTISTDDFYESVIFGRLPQVVLITGGPKRLARMAMPEKKKPLAKRGIDLTDDQLRQVVEKWQRKETALDLPFIHSVWRRDGKEHLAD